MADEFNYGGQAVIEGVMIRGQKAVVTAVRCPGGDVVMDTQQLAPIFSDRVRKMPLLRGIIVLIEALSLGIKAMLYSANVSLEEEEEKISGAWVWVMIFLSLGMAVVLFFLAPLFLTRLLNAYINSSIVFHLVEGFIRMVIFIAYLKVMTLFPDIRRVFAYHGAEHKVINTYEDGAPLDVASARKYKTAHTRCGTSFLFVVLLIAIIVFALVGSPALWLMILARIVLVPVIAALGYEIIYFGARHTRFGLVTAVLAPGMWLQSLTTREPDDSQLEVALTALGKVLEIDQLEKV
ncbi:DUF1385 domain-containing protein [Chloroflexota bacterium]